MKKTLLTLLLSFIFFSCSKDTNKNPTNQIIQQNATGLVRYKVNGNRIAIDHVDPLTGQYTFFYKQVTPFSPIVTSYLLIAQKDLGADNLLNINIITDSLNLGNYHMDSTSLGPLALKYNGQNSGIVFSGDFFDVNITAYLNSRVSGTFAAKLTPISDLYGPPPPGSSIYGPPGSIIISEGVFDSVQVIYFR